MNLYFRDGWHCRDTRVERAVPLMQQGRRVLTDHDIFTEEELTSEPILREFTIPNGFRWGAYVGFTAGSMLWGLCLRRTAKHAPFDARAVQLLGTLPDRLSEVATLSTAVGRVGLTGVTHALGLVRCAAIAVDRFGVVLDANEEAHRFFDDDLNVRCRRLTTTDREAAACLKSLMDRFLIVREHAPLLTRPIIVRRKYGGAIVIHVLPVPPAARNPFLGARALLTFAAIGERPRLDISLIGRIFGLTPAEARLAALLAQGLSLEAAAEKLGVKIQTVRNQLKAIFAKTDTNRQAQLVSLLAGFSLSRREP
ncbi:MAG: LuxR C-terminal-related transcriptional regulator [Alphaproteobacteria bacterium]|nr:LuxR C-terminal-related transcriptional regulator [Alphaproteobacteria bacterium]